jgi:spore maturation protein CgeB
VKFFILNTDYPEFLYWLYSKQPALEKACYADQFGARMETLFGVADFYSSNLRRLGHEAWDVHANNKFMQKAWASENSIPMDEPMVLPRRWQNTGQVFLDAMATAPLRHVGRLARPLLRGMKGNCQPAWVYDVLSAQIKRYRPDVVLNQDMALDGSFFSEMRPHIRFLVGQHAATRLSASKDWSYYDLIISSFLPTVEFFRQRGVPSELNRLGFEPKILSCLPPENRNLDVTFIGSFHSVHKSRTGFLEALCLRFPQLRIWGPGLSSLSSGSPIRQCYMGQAWGREMYRLLHRSKIVLNHHGDIRPWANNLRLFEATGVGALLVTDWKENLSEMFEPGNEVAAYRTLEECIELVSYYLEHEEERASVAHAGQERTLRDHHYYKRMEEFVDIVRNYL